MTLPEIQLMSYRSGFAYSSLKPMKRTTESIYTHRISEMVRSILILMLIFGQDPTLPSKPSSLSVVRETIICQPRANSV